MATLTKSIHPGGKIDHTPGSAVAAGDVVVVGNLVCVAPMAIAAGALGSLDFDGEHEFPLNSSAAIDAGDPAYWDVADQEINEDDANPLAGFATADADGGDGDETICVRLAGQQPPPA